MQETKITWARVKHHFAYSWWKYLVMVVAVIFGWNLVYTTTAYRAPKDKRMDIYFATYSVPEETQEWLAEQVRARYPQLEDASVYSILYTPDDDTYGSMQLTTYMGAQEGDVMILPRERFDMYADTGAFVALDEAIESGALDLQGIDASRGYRTTEDGEEGTFGIPLTELYGLMDWGVDNRDLVAGVLVYSQTQEVAIDWIGWLIETMQAPKPQSLVDAEEQRGTGMDTLSDMPSY